MLPNAFRSDSSTPDLNRPSSVRLELTSRCQLRCPVCPTGRRITKDTAVGWGAMGVETFRRFLDMNSFVKRIELSNYGEALLAPDFEAILEHGHGRGIEFHLFNGANLNTAKDSALEAIVKYQVRSLTASIDGASPETYSIYRQGGNFTSVIENIRKINAFKKLHESPFPAMRWQFIVFGHNEHEIAAARAMASELGMSFFPKINWDKEYAPLHDPEAVGKQIGVRLGARLTRWWTRVRYNANTEMCGQLWRAPQVNWDGKLLGCCVNISRGFGNVFEDGLEACLSRADFARMRKVVSGKELPSGDIPCIRCGTWNDHLKYRYAGQMALMRLRRKASHIRRAFLST